MTIDLDYLNEKNCQLLENICIQKQSDYSKLIFEKIKFKSSNIKKQRQKMLRDFFIKKNKNNIANFYN